MALGGAGAGQFASYVGKAVVEQEPLEPCVEPVPVEANRTSRANASYTNRSAFAGTDGSGCKTYNTDGGQLAHQIVGMVVQVLLTWDGHEDLAGLLQR